MPAAHRLPTAPFVTPAGHQSAVSLLKGPRPECVSSACSQNLLAIGEQKKGSRS